MTSSQTVKSPVLNSHLESNRAFGVNCLRENEPSGNGVVALRLRIWAA